jgi:hydroxyacylglutathione hydrolase
MFRRFFDDGLAQSSYLVASLTTREAAVVDPRRDVEVYLAAARESGVQIVFAIETHVHADFVSGARELAALGARIVAGPGAGLRFPHHDAAHGEQLKLGDDVTLTLLHTPGHTPEHISVLVEEGEAGAPRRVLTGDTLFVSAVGRPDLLGEEHARQLARQLFDSLHDVLLPLGDDVEVHPGHGAGSLCGAGIGQADHTTIGQERRFNAFLQHGSKEAFVAAVLADLPETPPYFPRMKRLNAAGPPVLGPGKAAAAPPRLDPAEAGRLVSAGALVLDLRSPEAFATGHPTGAIHLEFGPKVGYWAGWIVPGAARVLLVADGERQAAAAKLQLARVGIDGVAGYVGGGLDAWQKAGLPVSSGERIDVAELVTRLDGPDAPAILDVRSRHEFDLGHLQDAAHVPLNEVAAHAPSIPAGPVVTICESGYRASLAASLLARQGLDRVTSVSGGMSAYRELESRSGRRRGA